MKKVLFFIASNCWHHLWHDIFKILFMKLNLQTVCIMQKRMKTTRYFTKPTQDYQLSICSNQFVWKCGNVYVVTSLRRGSLSWHDSKKDASWILKWCWCLVRSDCLLPSLPLFNLVINAKNFVSKNFFTGGIW